MHFSKSQREKLNKLSYELFGVESRWAKMMDSPQLQVATSEVEEHKDRVYVQLPSKRRGKPGQIMRLETAVSKGLVENPDEFKSGKNVVTKTRKPTFEEMVDALVSAIDGVKSLYLSDVDRTLYAALRFTKGTLGAFGLSPVPESQKEDFDSIVNSLRSHNPELADKISNAVGKTSDGLLFDPIRFASGVVFCATQPEEAAKQVEKMLAEIDLVEIRKSGK